jgi:Do/DeqQ family serine protease
MRVRRASPAPGSVHAPQSSTDPTSTPARGRTDMTLRKLWLVFAQAVTVAMAVLFVVATLRPELLGPRAPALAAPPGAVVINQAGEPAPAAGAAVKANSFSAAVQRASPAVVNVSTARQGSGGPGSPLANDPLFRRFFGEQDKDDERRTRGMGSGVIVSPQGYILTNYHVIDGMDEIVVSLNDGRDLRAKAVGSDPETDLAVLKVEGGTLPAITFGTLDAVQTGDVVLAIGNPLGVGKTVTMGIVSALGRTGLGINTFENFIQTDAAINQGNSGGALVDTAGNLIGINTAILSGTGGSIGIGFAIPVSTAKTVMQQIIENGTVTRGFIGVEAREITPELVKEAKLAVAGGGAFVARVLPDGPADRGGVRAGDVLLAINGKPVADPSGMLNIVAELAPGSQATMKLKRGEKEVDVGVTVARRPPAPTVRRR